MQSYGQMRKKSPNESNSMNKFVREFSQLNNEGEFLRAKQMFPPNTSQFPNQSKFSLKRPAATKLAPIFIKENYAKRKPKPLDEIQLLPASSTKKPLIRGKTEEPTQPMVESQPMLGRELVVITGGVQYALKTLKLYPHLKVLYEIFGNIMKIHKGMIQFEHIILIRKEAVGPVLRGFYFDFTNSMEQFKTGSSIRCIGQFTTQDRFRIHKIEEYVTPPPDAVLTRIQNISTFALLQMDS